MSREFLTQEAIIIARSATDTVTMLIKDHTGNDDQIDMPVIRRRLRLRYTHTTATHHILSVIRTNLHRVTMGNR